VNDAAIARCFQGVIDYYPATIVSDSGTELNRNALLAWSQARGVG
jgi:hypothetical protein